ncbi:lipopolysaccharide biosynthesis protein [Gelidibacter salicanalis]|uniref:lipopolysaccharide biosynthesis protein n=1 Tax=Gelidibacter salicanalis TaxID=291193 RepID=UPI001478457F|nr:oligosaccharide flippase family protein [Gelidibacter salicanalis]
MKKGNEFVKRIKASLYIRNVATLASGTTLAQIITFFTAPILYRIYSKVDYGTLGLYIAIVGVVGVFSSMQYLQPILLEKEDNDAKQIMWLNRLINSGMTVIVLVTVVLFGDNLGEALGNKALMPWLYLAPISFFFSGQNQIFSIWANRKKEYRILSLNAILTAILVPIVSITIGLYHNGPLGLFLGLMIGQIVPPILFFITLNRNDVLSLDNFNWKIIKQKSRDHKQFPMYSLPSEFINRLTNQLPVFMLSTYAGPAVVGIYNLSVRMLGLPIQLIGGAITQVFQQQATESYNAQGHFKHMFCKTVQLLSIVALPGLLIIIFFGPQLFAFIFGLEWRESGVFAQILVGMFVLKLIVAPISYAYYIRNMLKENMMIHIYLLISMLIIFFIGFKTFEDYKSVILLYVINYSFVYILYLLRTYHFSKP